MDLTAFYEHIRKSYNQKHSTLYKNIVIEELKNPNDSLTTLSALLTQILLFSKKVENKQMFLRHARCNEITAVTIPESVTSIGREAFAFCGGITSLTILSREVNIGEFAFLDCSGIKSVTISTGVTKLSMIFKSYYYNTDSLEKVIIVDGVTHIGDGMFQHFSGLKSVSIPASVTSIGSSAFYNCSGLTSMTIPKGVKSIGSKAFWMCLNLPSIGSLRGYIRL